MRWTREQDRELRRQYALHKKSELPAILNRSLSSIVNRIHTLQFKKPGHYFSAVEDAVIRKEYPGRFTGEVAKLLGRTPTQVYQRANRLGVSKTPECAAALRAQGGRVGSLHPKSIAARIQKGNVPPNKGLRRPGWFRGRMRETQFKKGERTGAAQRKWRPVGTISMRDGYLMMKVKDEPESVAGKGAHSTNWMYVHKMVWESARGMIPAGHRIWWKDGNHENCAIENLELLSDKEHMARTTIHNWPPELKQVVMLKGALKHRITTLRKKERADAKQQNVGPSRPSVQNARRAAR